VNRNGLSARASTDHRTPVQAALERLQLGRWRIGSGGADRSRLAREFRVGKHRSLDQSQWPMGPHLRFSVVRDHSRASFCLGMTCGL
jgi:hypothetical protein